MNIMAEMSTAFVLSGYSENTVSQQSSPGILVFSHSRQLQYVNRRALELTQTTGQAMTELASIALPSRLLALRDQIQESLDDRLRDNIWEPFEVSRVVYECGQRLLLRGFGHLDREASHNSRIIIVLEELRSAEKDENHKLCA